MSAPGTDNVLARIVNERREDVAAAREAVPIATLRMQAAGRARRSIAAALLSDAAGPRIVAEVKQASPSAGVLRPPPYDPAGIARSYAAAGAAAISVLTEPRHFGGSADHLRLVRAAVGIPILRKDFLCDPYQVWEAAAWGADAILIIAAALEAAEIRALHAAALEAGLESIVEIHDAEELPAALGCPGAIVGVNSRDLRTLRTNLDIARGLAPLIPRDRLCIAESGIRSRAEIADLAALGYRGFLVGESLLRRPDPGLALKALLSG